MKSLKHSRALALSLILCLVLPFTFGFTNARGEPAMGAGCSTAGIESYAPDIIDGSREVVRILKLKHADKAEQLDQYLGYAQSFYDDWKRNKWEGLANVPALLKSFQSTVVPLLDPNNTALQLAAAGVDFALRKFARYWVDNKGRVQQSATQVLVAQGTAKAKGVDLMTADQAVEEFLSTPKVEKPK